MKSKFARAGGFFTLLVLTLSVCSIGQAQTPIIKADTTTMNTAADWSGTVPDFTTSGQFDTTISSGNEAALTLGGSVTLAGLLFGTLNGPVTVGGGNTLTLGNSGIDMSAASASVTLNNNLKLAGGIQSWNVVNGQTLTIAGPLTHTGASVDFTGFAGTLGTLGNVNGILGPWATTGYYGVSLNSIQYATVSGGIVSGYTGTVTTTAADVTDTTGTVNYEVSADGTVGAGASFNTLRYMGAAGSITRTNIMGDFTANGLMNATNSNCWISGNVTVGPTKELVLTGGTNTGTLFTFVGTFTGASDTVITIAATNAQIIGFGNPTDGAQFANFFGTVNLGNTADIFKFRNDFGPLTDKGMGNATLDLGAAGQAQFKSTAGVGANSGSVTETIGSIIGGVNTSLRAGDSSGGNGNIYTYKVGGLNSNAEFDGTIGGGSAGTVAITKAGTGTWRVPHANTYGGITTISGGTLSTGDGGTLANGGTASSIGTSANSAANLVLDGGTLQYANTNIGAVTSDRLFTLTQNGGALDASGADTLTFAGGGAGFNVVFSGSGARTLTLAGTNTGANTDNLILGDNGGDVTSLTKSGTGQWVLGNVNTYSGTTVISNGTLTLRTGGSIANSASYTVSRGATLDISAVSFGLGGSQTLFGGGTINGSVSTVSGSKVYAGADGGYGTNTINNDLTMASGASFYLDVGTVKNGSNDLVTMGGTLTLNSTVFHLKAPGTSVSLDQTGDYVLMTATSISGTVAGTPVWDVAPLNAINFSVVVSGNQVKLHYTASTPPAGTGSATPSSLSRGQPTRIVITVTPGSNPVIGSVNVDLTSIGGPSSASLVSSNSTYIYTNTFTIGNVSAGVKSLLVTIVDSLSVSGTTSVGLTVLPGNEVWNGLGADNNWTSGLNWLGGLAPQSGDSLIFAGTTQLTPNLDNSYTLASLNFSNTAGSFIIGTANSSNLTLTGGLTNNSANAQILNVPITLNTTQAINTTNGDVTLGGVVSGNSGLIKSGTNTLTLSGVTSIYTGPTIINNGNLVLGNSAQLGSGGSYGGNITNNGTLTVNNGVVQTISGVISGTGSLINSSGTLTLSGVNTYSGTTTVSGSGTLKLGGSGVTATAAGTNTIFLSSGGTLAPGVANAALYKNNVVVANNDSVTIAPTITSAGLIGSVTGTNSTLNINLTAVSGLIYNFAGTNAGTQFAGFSGTIAVTSSTGGILKFRNDFGTNTDKGLRNVTLSLGSGNIHIQTKAANGSGINSGSVTQTIGALSSGGVGSTLEGGDGSNTNTYTYNVGGLNTDAEFDGVIGPAGAGRGTLAIIKSGSGTWTLTRVETYTGNTTISNGVLALGQFVDQYGSIAGSAVIDIKSGAVLDVLGRADQTLSLATNQQLRGRGTIRGLLNTALGSMVAPGDSLTNGIGTLTVTNSITLGGTAWMKLNRASSPNSDQLVSSTANSIIEGGTLIVTNIGPHLQAGDTFTLFGAGTAGSFANVVLPSYYTWNTNLLVSNGQISVTAGLPLPAITSVNFSGLAGGSITLNATNGAPGGNVIVLTSTNLALPLSSWTPAVTNSFDINGNLNGVSGLSIPVPVSRPQQFFTLQVF